MKPAEEIKAARVRMADAIQAAINQFVNTTGCGVIRVDCTSQVSGGAVVQSLVAAIETKQP
jgi:hypothetical protein